MPAAILEQSSEPTSPVFVAGGRRRNLGVRLIAAALGLLLAGWLAALAAGLIGFSPLPELALPGTGNGQTAPAAPEQGPGAAGERTAASAHGPSIASRPGGEEVSAAGRRAPDGSGSGTSGGGIGNGEGSVTGSTPPETGVGPPQSQTTPPAGHHPTPASSGNPPSFTPPAGGEKSANPPRGNSANAPGRANSAGPPGSASSANAPGKSNSANPPGRATRAHSG